MCAKDRARTRRSCKTRAGTSRSPSAALPACESCPPWSDRRGPRCAHRLPPRLNRRQNERGGSARRGGWRRRPRLALLRRARRGRTAPRSAKPRARPEGIGAASPRANDTRPGPRRCAALRLNACTDGAAAFQLVPASTAPRRPFRRCALLEHPRANHSAALRVASLLALRLAISVPLLRRCTANASRRSLRSPLAPPSPARPNQNQQRSRRGHVRT